MSSTSLQSMDRLQSSWTATLSVESNTASASTSAGRNTRPRRRARRLAGARAPTRAAGEAEALPEPAGDGDDQPVSSLSSAASTPTGRRPSPDARSTPPGRPAASEAATLGGSLALWRALDGALERGERGDGAAPPAKRARVTLTPSKPDEAESSLSSLASHVAANSLASAGTRDAARALADLDAPAPENAAALLAPLLADPARARGAVAAARALAEGSPTRTAADAEAARAALAPTIPALVRLLGHDDADVLEHAAGCLAAVARGSDARRDAARTRAPSRLLRLLAARLTLPPRPPPAARSPSPPSRGGAAARRSEWTAGSGPRTEAGLEA
ncbi:hypothetical protein JL722_8349 [Aureococcus anophagefferens]|nr:hypothetical protein JL722_8349 [Aureococcus anophagefferens]